MNTTKIKDKKSSQQLLTIAKKEFKYILDRIIFLDQNGQELKKSLFSQAIKTVLSKIKSDVSLGGNSFYKIRCKEKSQFSQFNSKVFCSLSNGVHCSVTN